MRLSPIEITVPRLHSENAYAITLWPFILYRRGFQNNVPLRCHEYFHWRQALRWGVIPWYLTYLLLQVYYITRPPREHPLEAPAYAKQDEVELLIRAGKSVDQHLTELGVTVRV